MHRQPKAVGPRAVPRPLVAALAAVAVLLMVMPAAAFGRGPVTMPAFPPSVGPDGRNADLPRRGVPWSAGAVELAHTSRKAVLAGTTEEACTGWRSEFAPPPSIRVLRTFGPNAGQVEVVPFEDYVLQVMASEWAHDWAIETVKVGAIAVKQYGWYYTIVYRGGKSTAGECYDVRDNTIDQLYAPGSREIFPAHRTAAKATWGVTVRKWNNAKARSLLILTGYRTGVGVACAADADKKLLYQRSIFRCGNKGYTYEQILRMYYTTKHEIVEPGGHDIVGAELGDASVLLRAPDDTRTPVLFEHQLPGGFDPPGGAAPTIGAVGFAGARSADVDRDGRDDLVTLHLPASGGYRLSVAESDGAGYGAFTTWSEATSGDYADTELVTGDFNADQRRDAAMLRPLGAGNATLELYASTGSAFAAPVAWWTGSLDLAVTKVWAADANGDGRVDLVMGRDAGANGMVYSVAVSRSKGGGLDAPTTWYSDVASQSATLKHVVGDANRDGRDDLWLVTPTAYGIDVSVLLANRSGVGFTREDRWASTPSNGIDFDEVRLGSADVDLNGFGDLVLVAKQGADGSRITPLAACTGTMACGYVRMDLGTSIDAPALDWSRTAPY